MAKKTMAKRQTKKRYEKSKTQIQKMGQTFLRRLQQVVEESCDRVSPRTRNTSRESSSKRDPVLSHADVCNEDIKRDNYTCYRCQHFLEIPHNLTRLSSNTVSILERCKEEVSFVQAIVWLKSTIACASQIPVERLQKIFNGQWNTRDERHCENNCTDDDDAERLKSFVNEDLVSEGTNMRDIFVRSTPLDISDIPYTPQRNLYTRSEDAQSKLSINDQSLVGSVILGSSNNCDIATREKKKEVKSFIIPETDIESILSEDRNMFDDIPDHQWFEFEKDTGCSGQSASNNGIQQINKKINENKHILQKSHANISNKYIFTPTRNQSVDSMFELENNFNGKHFTSTRSQNDLANKVLESNGSPKSVINITPKAMSQISNVNINDEYFEFSFNDNSPWQSLSNTKNPQNFTEDSAYSTSRNDIFSYDIVEAGLIASNKPLQALTSPDNEPYYKLQSCNKKTTMYETRKISSSTSEMLTFDDNPKNLIITQKNISQMSDVYNNENFEFQIVNNYDDRMSDIIFEDSKNDAAVITEFIDNKCTPNIEHCYKLDPCNKKTTTREQMTASPSIIQGAKTPNTNIAKHRYNLRARNKKIYYNLQTHNNKKISHKKEGSSIMIEDQDDKSKGCKSRHARNLVEKENENEDKMISVDWLNFTLDSLHIERVIIKSIKVILSTLCDKKTVEEYMIKEQQRNTRNYWKDSLEEEAINAVLNISDIFTTKKKPNICINVIMKVIIKTFDEMTVCSQLKEIYGTETSVWIYRVQIILEFCNSLPICIKITDYLIIKLKLLQSNMTNVKKSQEHTYMVNHMVMINQLHLIFYALNITLRKYRTIVPSDQRSRSAKKVIPHVADLWKIHYIDKELEYTDIDLDATEKRWLNALENSTVVFTKHFVQFAEKSLSLVHVLISQSSTRIT